MEREIFENLSDEFKRSYLLAMASALLDGALSVMPSTGGDRWLRAEIQEFRELYELLRGGVVSK